MKKEKYKKFHGTNVLPYVERSVWHSVISDKEEQYSVCMIIVPMVISQ